VDRLQRRILATKEKMTTDNIFPLFAVPIYQDHIIDNLDKEIEYIKKNIIYKLSSGNYLSENTKILEIPELEVCKTICKKSLKLYSDLVFDCEQQLYITNSWIAKTLPGQHHQVHYHPNSIVSGVLYLKAEKNKSTITFRKKSMLKKNYDFDYHFKSYNIFNSDAWTLPVESSQILLFPSWIDHEVSINKGQNERLILGFNSFVCGNFGKNNYSSDLTV
jgi:uncharacterized protein (TIGR02466 family)